MENILPINEKQRHIILDFLRGFALLGICLANYPEFSLWTFLSSENQISLSTYNVDKVVRFLQYFFIDAKFYSIFSILFGIGFSIILSNAFQRGGNGKKLFFRRMSGLMIIGFLHLMFIWSGDILLLYAVTGMFLPFFYNLSDKKLIYLSLIFISFPIVLDFIQEIFNIRFAQFFVNQQWQVAEKYSITEENFAFWLRDADSYEKMFQFLKMGFFERMSEFVDGHRFFKVLGLFLLGFYIGRKKLFANLADNISLIKKVFFYGLIIGLPANCLYAWSAVNSKPLGLTIHSVFYTFSALPLALVYISAFAIIYIKKPDLKIFTIFSVPGRFALTNYIMQSVLGVVLFYGLGFALGTKFGLFETEIIAFFVFIFEIFMSFLWFKFFKFGPLEWIWRIYNYGKILPIRR